MLKDHVLNLALPARTALQLRPKFHSLFLQNSFDFQKKVLHLKHLNSHLEQGEVTPIDFVLTPATAVKNFDLKGLDRHSNRPLT